MLSRRAFVGKLAAGAAAVGAVATVAGRAQARPSAADGAVAGPGAPAASGAPVTVAGASAPLPPGSELVASGPAPWELLQPLQTGTELSHGWTLAELSPVHSGVSVATLRNAQGRTHRVHVCRNDGTPAGVVHTERHDLVVMNGGAGALPTDEGLAQAVAALAHAVAANEAGAAVPGLQAHAERVTQYGASAKLR